MKVKCERCKYEWDYNGRSKYYASCPMCHKTIKIKEVSEDGE